ncbi:MAG TPA: copper resistance CopC family protein [Terriglobales bacterium]|nr:copper resistance CopC family protein [Terriglobales bacterium]
MTCRIRNLLYACVFSSLVAVSLAPSALAHAILVETSPAIHGKVKGPEVVIKLRFNVRVDATRSRLSLVQPDGSSRPLPIAKQDKPDWLGSKASGLRAGSYRIRWQVLSSDGHITNGEIPFTVE